MARHQINNHLSLAIPDDWELWEPADDTLFVAAAPEMGQDDIQPHFFVSRSETENDSSEACMLGNLIHLRETQEGYTERSIEMLQVDGHDIAAVTYDAPAAHWNFTNKQYFLALAGYEYLITCKMLPEQAETWLTHFDAIAASARITNG